jgi:hypothetical protein
MLDCRRVDALSLRITDQDIELPLRDGAQAVARDAGSIRLANDDAEAVARFCVDRRGIWLTVAERAGGVHVNGRRIRRMAMLRLGDAIYIDGVELVLCSNAALALPDDALYDAGADANGDARDLRVLLRGVGGKHHGRAFTLEQPRLVGSAPEADIRIDDPVFADRHAQVSLVGGQVVLRDLGTSPDGSVLNGRPVRDALLAPGDQIAFDARHRFVVEAPGNRSQSSEPMPMADYDPAGEAAPPRPPGWRRWPWLLLAALLIGGALAALLLLGSDR